MRMPARLLLCASLFGLIQASAVAEPVVEYDTNTTIEERTGGFGHSGGLGEDFMRPQFEHEKNRGYSDRSLEERRGYRGEDRGLGTFESERRGRSGMEREWEGLDDDR